MQCLASIRCFCRPHLLGALRRGYRHLLWLLPLPLGLLPRRARARRARAVGRILRQPLACPLQILKRLAQQRPRLLWRKIRHSSLVELSEIVVAEVHSVGAGRYRNRSLGAILAHSDEICLATS
jgi:hypothetical protein